MHWLRNYLLLTWWHLLRMRVMLPVFAVVQAGLAVGVVVGFAYLNPALDPVSVGFLVTGGPTVGLITVGLVLAPQSVAQAKVAGAFEFDRTLPVPRLAVLAAELTIWTLAVIPGIVLALIVAALRFDLTLRISPLVVPAVLLVTVTATAIGYGLAYALPPMATTMASQVLVFVTLLFSPVTFPASRLPEWLQAVHRVLPMESMATAVRETLLVPVDGVAWRPFAVMVAWCTIGLLVAVRVTLRRG